jgi:LPXTG-motif cell wall-anchored protein
VVQRPAVLPRTGDASSLGLGFLGCGLIAAGGALALAARKREDEASR